MVEYEKELQARISSLETEITNLQQTVNSAQDDKEKMNVEVARLESVIQEENEKKRQVEKGGVHICHQVMANLNRRLFMSALLSQRFLKILQILSIWGKKTFFVF